VSDFLERVGRRRNLLEKTFDRKVSVGEMLRIDNALRYQHEQEKLLPTWWKKHHGLTHLPPEGRLFGQEKPWETT